jgi:hypothetical protein
VRDGSVTPDSRGRFRDWRYMARSCDEMNGGVVRRPSQLMSSMCESSGLTQSSVRSVHAQIAHWCTCANENRHARQIEWTKEVGA